MEYVIYKTATGEITRSYKGPLRYLPAQLEPGESFVVGTGAWATHKVMDGVIVSADNRPIAIAREQAWEEVKKWRAAAIDADLVTPYGAVDSKESDRKNITDAVMLAQTLHSMAQPVAISFTMADNSVVVMDASMMTTVGLLLGQKTQAAHARARELRAQIETATKEELQALTWD